MTTYKRFAVDNRYTQVRSSVVSIVFPFHEKEIIRSTVGDPIGWLNENLSVVFNNTIYPTAWVEVGAPWLDATSNDTYVRFVRADIYANNIPVGETTGWVTGASNTIPAYIQHPSLVQINEGLITARYSGAQIAAASANLSGSSSGIYTANLWPLNASNAVEGMTQRGLTRTYKTEVWLGHERHLIDHVKHWNNIYENTPGRYVTGFCHAEMWMTTYSNSSYIDYTFRFGNDKLNNPVRGFNGSTSNNEVESIYHSAYITGDFSLRFNASIQSSAIKFYSGFGFTESGFLGNNHHYKLPINIISDAQRWGFKATVDYANTTGAFIQARYPIYGIPIPETYMAAGYLEYPVVQNPALIPNSQRMLYRTRTNGNKLTNLWNTLGNPWDNNIVGISIKTQGDSGFQARFGRIPIPVLPIIYSNSADAIDICMASELRMTAWADNFRGLFNNLRGNITSFLPSRIINPIVDGNLEAVTEVFHNNSPYVYLKNGPERHSSGAGLGRRRGRDLDPAAYNFGTTNTNGWIEMRRDHFGKSITFYVGLTTDDPYFKDYMRETAAVAYGIKPPLGAGVTSFNSTRFADSHYAEPRTTARPLRAYIQDWLLNNNNNSRTLYTREARILATGMTGANLVNGRDLVWETVPGIHASSERYGQNRERRRRNLIPGQPIHLMLGFSNASPESRCESIYRSANAPYRTSTLTCGNVPISGNISQPIFPGDASPRLMVPVWQFGMMVDRLALGYKHFNIPELRETIRNSCIDLYNYWHVPNGNYNTWVYNTTSVHPGHPNCPGMTKLGILEAVEENTEIGWGPLNAGTGLGQYSVSHDDLTSWGYAGTKAAQLVFTPSDGSNYTNTLRTIEANEFVRGFRDPVAFNNAVPTNAGSYMYVGDWTFQGTTFPPNSDPNTRPIIYTVDFTGTSISGYAPLTATFSGIVTPAPAFYHWDSDGNGVIDARRTDPTLNVLYSVPGFYTVTLVAGSGQYSGSTTKFNYVNVLQQPNYSVDFTGTPRTGVVPFEVVFTDLTTPTPVTRVWDIESNGQTISTSGVSVTGTYTTSGSKTVSLYVFREDNVLAGSSIKGGYIQANAPINRTVWTNIDFTGSPRISYGAADVTFTSQIEPTPENFRWDFNDNGIYDSALESDTYRYNTTGLYSVSLRAWSGAGETYSEAYIRKSNYIDIRELLVLYNGSFTANILSGQVPLSVTFTDTTTPAPTTTKYWDFENDGVTNTITNSNQVTHTYQTTGLKSVRMSGISSNGTAQAFRQNYIFVEPINYNPDISATVLSGYAPLTVTLSPIIDQTLIQPNVFNWNYGIGTSTLQSPTVTYTTPGEYDISLTCSRANIGNGSVTRESFIRVLERTVPSITFNANKTTEEVNRPILFTFSYGLSAPTAWYLDFGDGATQSLLLSQTSFSYSYPNAGVYEATLYASNQAGTISKTIDINILESNSPKYSIANFSGDVLSGVNPLTINFTDLSTEQSSIVDRTWSFGDGGEYTGQNPSYTYDNSGIYNVSLTVTSLGGTSIMTKESYITVSDRSLDQLEVSIHPSIDESFYPAVIFYRDTTSGDISSRSWNLINGQSGDSTAEIPCVVYTNPGFISPGLVTTSSSGVSSTGYFENLIELIDLNKYSPSANYSYQISNFGTVVKEDASDGIFYNPSVAVHRRLQATSPTTSTAGLTFSTVSGNYNNSIITLNNITQSIVNKARLHLSALSITGNISGGDMIIDAYRSPLTNSSPSWNRRSASSPTVNWSSPGATGAWADYIPTPIFSFTVPISATGNTNPENATYTFDITDYMRRTAHDNGSSILFVPRYNSDAFVTMATRGIIDIRYRNIPANIIAPDVFVIQNGTLSTLSGYPIVSGYPGHASEMKTIIRFNLDDAFGSAPLNEVALTKAILTIPYQANTSYEYLPVLNKIKRDVDSPNWVYYSGSSQWTLSGASGIGSDIDLENISVLYPDVVTGDYISTYGSFTNKVDVLQYDLTDDLDIHLQNQTSRHITYLLSYPRTTFDATTSNYVIATPTTFTYSTDLHIYSTYIRSSEPVPIVPIDPGDTGSSTGSTGNTGTTGLTGTNFVIYRGDPNNGYITDALFATTSGYLFDGDSNYIRGNQYNHYEKLFVFNTTANPISNIKLRILGEHQHQIYIANEKNVGDNNSGSYNTLPSGYYRSDFIRCDSRNNYISLGNLDTSGYTGFWVKIEVPENIRTDSGAFLYPVISYEIPGEE